MKEVDELVAGLWSIIPTWYLTEQEQIELMVKLEKFLSDNKLVNK